MTALDMVDIVFRATLVLAIAALLATSMRRASAASRHVVWIAGLLGALLLPPLWIALPEWQLPLVTLPATPSTEMTGAADTTSLSSMTSSPVRRGGSWTPSEPPARARTLPELPSWPVLLLSAWAAGAVVVSGRLAAGLIVVRMMTRRSQPIADAAWLPLARQLASDLGITGRVNFRRTGHAMPMAWGLIRPAVVMPAEADTWPAERLRVVLLHELAHVKRRDCLTHALAQAVCALYWFHPLAWLAAKRLRTEREHACDDLVLAAGTRGSDYANQLLELARVMHAGRFPAVLAGATLAMAHHSQLEGRLMAILDTTKPRSGAGRFRTIAISVLFAVVLGPLASVQPWAYEVAAAAATPQTSQPGQAAPAPDARQSGSGALAGVPGGVAGGVPGGVRAGVPVGIPGAVQGGVPGGVPGGIPGGVEGGVAQAAVIVDLTPRWNPNLRTLVFEGEQKPADPKVIAALTAALKDTDADVRAAVLASLIQLRDPGLFQPLVQALSDPAADVRKQAAFGLGQMRDKRAFEPLLGALKDEDADVRTQAAFALGLLGDPRAIDALTAALKDASADVRKVAAFALVQVAR